MVKTFHNSSHFMVFEQIFRLFLSICLRSCCNKLLFQATYVYFDCFQFKPIRYIECNKVKQGSVHKLRFMAKKTCKM